MNDLELTESLRSTIERAAVPVSAGEAQLRGRERSTDAKSRWISPKRPTPFKIVTVSIVAAAVVLVVAFVTLGQGGGRAGNPGAPPPASTLSMRLVDSSSSPFASVGAGPQTGDLECVTASVCYASDTSGSAPAGSGVERTADGGATWHQTASLPGAMVLSWPLSCPTTETCLGVAQTAGSGVAAPASLRVRGDHRRG